MLHRLLELFWFVCTGKSLRHRLKSPDKPADVGAVNLFGAGVFPQLPEGGFQGIQSRKKLGADGGIYGAFPFAPRALERQGMVDVPASLQDKRSFFRQGCCPADLAGKAPRSSIKTIIVDYQCQFPLKIKSFPACIGISGHTHIILKNSHHCAPGL